MLGRIIPWTRGIDWKKGQRSIPVILLSDIQHSMTIHLTLLPPCLPCYGELYFTKLWKPINCSLSCFCHVFEQSTEKSNQYTQNPQIHFFWQGMVVYWWPSSIYEAEARKIMSSRQVFAPWNVWITGSYTYIQAKHSYTLSKSKVFKFFKLKTQI